MEVGFNVFISLLQHLSGPIPTENLCLLLRKEITPPKSAEFFLRGNASRTGKGSVGSNLSPGSPAIHQWDPNICVKIERKDSVFVEGPMNVQAELGPRRRRDDL